MAAAALRALSRSLRQLRRQPLAKLGTVAAMAVSLTLVGLAGLGVANLSRLGRLWSGGSRLTVYLDDDVTPARAGAIVQALAALPPVDAARLVDGAEAAARLRRALGDHGDVVDGLDPSFLPLSIEVALRGGETDALLLNPLLARLQRIPGVADVERAGDYSRKVGALVALVRGGALLLALVVIAACLFVVAATTRIGVLARRDELDILRLVGATGRYIAAPFLIEGAIEGVLAAGAAAVMSWAAFRAAAPRLEATLDFALRGERLAFARPAALAAWVAAGVLVGLAGSALALARMRRASV